MPSKRKSNSSANDDLIHLLSEMEAGGSGMDHLRENTKSSQKRRLQGSSTGDSSIKKRGPEDADHLKRRLRKQAKMIHSLRKQLNDQDKEIINLKKLLKEKSDQNDVTLWQARSLEIESKFVLVEKENRPFVRYWMLLEIESALVSLEVKDAESQTDQAFIAHSRERLSVEKQDASHDLTDPPSIDNLFDDIQAALANIKLLNSMMEGDWSPDDTIRNGKTFTQQVEELASTIRYLEKFTSSIAEVNLRYIPQWEEISRAKVSIVNAHRIDVFALKCAILVAKSDGRLAGRETEFLIEMAENVRMDFEEAKRFILETKSVKPAEFTGSPEDALEILQDSAACALADNIVPEKEYDMLLHIGKILKIPEEKIDEIIEAED